MPEISHFFGIVIGMFYNEHNPPHFHAKYQEHEAEIDIQTLRMLKGTLPKRVKAMVLEWAEEHREELLNDWNLGRERKNLNKIAPLE
ncbi:MAG: hypothetical protein A2046_16700 [Bacteroidetes bacterium GWA2_30_7]|nr:MAG: hypothetical protein A2046_16700 [Bacteroidetes bacterium GWA2_30_7]